MPPLAGTIAGGPGPAWAVRQSSRQNLRAGGRYESASAVRSSGLFLHGPTQRWIRQILFGTLQGSQEHDRASLRLPASRLQL